MNSIAVSKFKKIDLYYYFFCIFHLCAIIASMTVTSRILILDLPFFDRQFNLTGGLFFIPVVFFIQDIVTEIYGYANAKRMLNTSLILFSLYVFLILALSYLPLEYENHSFASFNLVSKTLPRHAFSFIVSLALGGRINNYVLFKLKLIFNNKFLAFRFISSTAIGEAFFQITAVLISWYGTRSINEILPLAVFSYSYKVLFEICVTPLNILICNYLMNLQRKELGHAF